MTFKRLLSLVTFVGCVLFSYAIVGAQTQTTTPTTAQPTTTSTNPRVVITDNLTQPTAATPATAAQPKTTTSTFGNHTVSVTDSVTAMPVQDTTNGKFFNVTKWDGSKWVTTRKWMPNPTTPNP